MMKFNKTEKLLLFAFGCSDRAEMILWPDKSDHRRKICCGKEVPDEPFDAI